MKRVLIFILIFMSLISLASAEIIFNQQPNEIYNLGDTINIPLTVKTTGSVTGVLSINSICNGQEINFYKNGVSLSSGEEKRMDASLILTKDVIGTMIGDCVIKATLGEAYILSNNFKISNIINLQIKESNKEFNPGENLIVEGNALKEDGKSANGFISLEMTTGEGGEKISQSETINNGYFLINVSLPKNMKAGAYSVLLSAYEKDSLEQTTNTGSATYDITIKQVPTNLEIILEDKEIVPGTNLKFKTILHDQSGENIQSVSIATIKDENDKIIQQTEKATNEFFEYPIPYNEAPSEWKIHAVSNKLESDSTFKILEKQYVEVELINRTLTIYNKGNVVYNKTVIVKIKNQTIEIPTNLDVDKSQKYFLTAPEGEYNVEVLSEGESKLNQQVMLTGKAIDVKKVSSFSGIIKYPLVWIFIVGVLGFVAFMVIRKGYQRSFIGHIGIPFKRKEEEYVPLSKNSLLKTSNKAELSLSLKGDKQNASLVCIKIKNLNEVQSKKSAVEETLQRIVNEAETSKAVIYENQDNLFFIFAPVKTKTFSNERSALNLAQKIKPILDNYNKLAKQKINFGISLNYGTIVAKQEKNALMFMSMGTLITASKRISAISSGEILLSDKIKEKLMSDVKAEKGEKDGMIYYIIKEIKDREAHGKFINDFVRRMEKK
ncbi:MAG: DUF4469 domain-containing protein [Candidatus Pacearchaeota archaeon]